MHFHKKSSKRSVKNIASFLLVISLSMGFISSSIIGIAQSEDEIRIWLIGRASQDEGNFVPEAILPLEVAVALSELGLTGILEAYSANQFDVEIRDAFDNGTLPEILATSNSLKLREYQLENEDFDAQLHNVVNSLQPLGAFVRLNKTAANYNSAVQLALREPICEDGMQSFLQGFADRGVLSDIAEPLSASYMAGDFDAISASLSPDSLMRNTRYDEPGEVSAALSCEFWGNTNLVFVKTIVAFETSLNLGHQEIIVVLQSSDDLQMRPLTVTWDPVSLNELDDEHTAFATQLDIGLFPGDAPEPAQISTPDGVVPEPVGEDRFGDFAWTPSASADVIFEIAEFDYETGTRLFFFNRGAGGENPAEQLLSTGRLWTTETTWNWRVWSISDSGLITFSDVRSFEQ
jgi:hypothetical protein